MKTLPFLTPIDEWTACIAPINARAEKLQRSIHDRAWRLAASVGIPRDMCCLHNASIDDEMRGWCAGNPERLRVAKLASAMLADWTPSHLARMLADKAWNRILGERGYAMRPERHVLPVNPHLLFRLAA